MHAVSIVIPVYNEAKKVASVLEHLIKVRGSSDWEIIAVDDGSDDGTQEVLAGMKDEIRVIRHPSNHGYGAALKTGILASSSRDVVMMDADGQHDPEEVPAMVESLKDHEFVIGTRKTQKGVPSVRKPGKLILKLVVSYLVGRKISDFNCGFRGGRRALYLKMLELLPDGFSFSTTSLVYSLKSRCLVAFHDVSSSAREGTSSVRIVSDGIKTIFLSLRLIMLFDPFRAFVMPSFFLILTGCVYQVYIFVRTGLHIEGGAILSILAGIILFHFGLLADQIASLRKEMSAQLGLMEDRMRSTDGSTEEL